MTRTSTRNTLRSYAEVALGRQRSPQHAEGPHMVRYLRAANVKDGVLDLNDVQSMNFTPSEQVTFSLRSGDVLVSEGSGSLKSVGAAAVWRGELEGTVCFQNTLLRLRPRPGTDGEFLGWWVRSAFGSGVFASIASGANIYHVSAERVRSLTAHFPPLEEQRQVASFLEEETARIDKLRTAKARHLALVSERWEATIHRGLTTEDSSPVELRRLGVRVTTGPFGTVFNASEYTDSGVPMINPLHIRDGVITPDLQHSVSHETAARLSRHQLRGGDLIVGRKGDLGRAALVQDHQDGWVCGSDCIALHPPLDRLRPAFLSYVMRSQFIRSQLLSRSLAATMPSLNEGNLLSLRLPDYSLEQQDRFVAQMDTSHAWTTRTAKVIQTQLALLAERRQALITAAVTGQIDVSTASGRGVDMP